MWAASMKEFEFTKYTTFFKKNLYIPKYFNIKSRVYS
jgi:hypothetical protein